MVTGVKGTKKIKKSKKFGSGHTKGQAMLVAGPAEDTIDLLKPFLFVLSAFYCMHLRPSVDEGTEAETAVLATLAGDNCRKRSHDTLPRHTFTTHIHDTCSRHTPTPYVHDTCSRHTLKAHSHDTLPRHTPTTHSHDSYSRCTRTTYPHDVPARI